MGEGSKLSIFDYTDYRKFMVDYYESRKKSAADFSHRSFAASAGINSSGLYTDIIKRRTNIKTDVLFKLAKAFHFNKRETDYFRNLVGFNQAKTLQERNFFFQKMIGRLHGKCEIIESDRLEYYSKWYYVAIRELCSYQKIKKNDSVLASSLLVPKIRPIEAERAINTLLRLELVKENSSGYLSPVSKTISTGNEVHSMLVANFQKSMAELAVNVSDRISAEHRNISTLTFSTNKKTYTKLHEEIEVFRKKLIGIIEESDDSDRVYHINFQIFPLSYLSS